MPESDGTDFGLALDRAFALVEDTKTVLAGPFRIQVCANAAATEYNVFRAFDLPDRAEDRHDFSAAIIAGPDDKLAAYLPPDTTSFSQFESSEYYALWLPSPHEVLYLFDFRYNRGMMWRPGQGFPAWLLTRPFLPLVHAHASATSWCPLHAAAVGRDNRFFLFVGTNGSGKTTAALACAAEGWDYAGDDLVLVNPERRLVAPIYNTGGLRAHGGEALAARLIKFCHAVSEENGERRYEISFNTQEAPCKIAGGEVDGIFLPRRQGSEAFRPEPARPTEVFRAMLHSTRLCAPGLAGPLTKKLLAISRMSNGYFIDTGNDPLAIPGALRRLFYGEPA